MPLFPNLHILETAGKRQDWEGHILQVSTGRCKEIINIYVRWMPTSPMIPMTS